MSAYEIGQLSRLVKRLERGGDWQAADAVLYALYVLRRMPALEQQWGFPQPAEPAPAPFLPRLATPAAEPSSIPRSAA